MLLVSKIFQTFFCGKSSIFVPQTLTKLLLSQDGCCLCTCNTVQSISDVAVLQQTEHVLPQSHRSALLENVLYQRAVSVRSVCHVCNENTTVIPEACRVHLQRPEARISRLGNAKLLPKTMAELSEVLGGLHLSPHSRHQQLQTWAPGCGIVLQCGV